MRRVVTVKKELILRETTEEVLEDDTPTVVTCRPEATENVVCLPTATSLAHLRARQIYKK
jgi:hypothetical protein